MKKQLGLGIAIGVAGTVVAQVIATGVATAIIGHKLKKDMESVMNNIDFTDVTDEDN